MLVYPTSIRLPPSTYERLLRVSRQRHLSMTKIIQAALDEWLEKNDARDDSIPGMTRIR
jgi:hypothetical protein